MGAYASLFEPEVGYPMVTDESDPQRANWIPIHAEASEYDRYPISLLETERLWRRFKKLGCNRHGYLEASTLGQPPISEDPFLKNQLNSMADEDGTVPFHHFCLYAQWQQAAPLDDKIRATFQHLSNGNPITKALLTRILGKVYPASKPATVDAMAADVIQDMTGGSGTEVEEEQFVAYCEQLPPDVLAQFTSPRVMPDSLRRGKHRDVMDKLGVWPAAGQPPPPRPPTRHTPASQSKQPTPTPQRQAATRQTPARRTPASVRSRPRTNEQFQPLSDVTLKNVAEKTHRRDWQRLANRLGFLQADIRKAQKRHMNGLDQVYDLLHQWRQHQGILATVATLQSALEDTGMSDVIVQEAARF